MAKMKRKLVFIMMANVSTRLLIPIVEKALVNKQQLF